MAEITLGADPEFAFVTVGTGSLVRPETVIRGARDNSTFGIDGAGRVAELRPAPATNPRGLVENIRTAMQEGINLFPAAQQYHWKAGGVAEEEPMGGHIHFGHSELKDTERASRVCSALNKTVAPLVLMAEDKEEAVMRRNGSNYGSLNGEQVWRGQAWGMEYRPLSSWLTSPSDALSVITASWLVAKNYDNDEFMDEVDRLPEVDNDFFQDCNKKVMAIYLQGIAAAMKKAIGWKDALNDMKPMFSLIINGKSFNTAQDMKQSWGLKIPALVATTAGAR